MKKYKRLEKYRKLRGYTLLSLAKKIGVSKQYLWDIEKGIRPLSYRLAYKISFVLEVPPDEIFLKDNKKTYNK